VECKLRCVNVRRVLDCRRAFRPAFRVSEITDDGYRSTMRMIVIKLGTRRSTGENFEFSCEYLGAPATSLEVLTTSLGVLTTSLGAPTTTCLGVLTTSLRALGTSLGAPRITVEQSGNNIFGNAAGATGNHSYYLSFNNC
jgi:hypothetical protein